MGFQWTTIKKDGYFRRKIPSETSRKPPWNLHIHPYPPCKLPTWRSPEIWNSCYYHRYYPSIYHTIGAKKTFRSEQCPIGSEHLSGAPLAPEARYMVLNKFACFDGNIFVDRKPPIFLLKIFRDHIHVPWSTHAMGMHGLWSSLIIRHPITGFSITSM